MCCPADLCNSKEIVYNQPLVAVAIQHRLVGLKSLARGQEAHTFKVS